MAFFEGSLKDFNHYIGPIARNIIQQMTKVAKKGKCCEICHRGDVELQAAHVHGEERVQIIEFILNQYYKTSKDLYRVDLEEFVEKFKQYHYPLEKHFLFLCEYCHKKYDSEEKECPSLLEVKNFLLRLSPEEKEKFLKENNLKIAE